MVLGVQIQNYYLQMIYDVIIIGGGLAGLALSIDLKLKGHSILLIEKSDYPRNKVCGEYISMESYMYLHSLCPSLNKYELPKITQFKITSLGKNTFNTPLDLGGFGVSRFLLEDLLYQQAISIGVQVVINTKVEASSIGKIDGLYQVQTKSEIYLAKIVCNTSGRKSNIEAKSENRIKSKNNYIGVKYHIKLDRNTELIEIHNFKGGYCGISSIENDMNCLCYIVNSEELKKVGNSIQRLEKEILSKNSQLKNIFSDAVFLFKEPYTISGINFNIKERIKDGTFLLGDAAGSIAPITGNGMSIALRSAFTLSNLMDAYFKNEIDLSRLNIEYDSFWTKNFSSRIKYSRHLQKLSESPFLTQLTIGLFNTLPFIPKKVMII